MTVTYTTEDLIRHAVGSVLGGRYRGRTVCASCLVNLALELLHAGWRRSEVELAVERVFKTPKALMPTAIGPCARCRRSMPCLGERRREEA